MATAAKFVLPIPIFLAYLVPLDVDVTGKASPRKGTDKIDAESGIIRIITRIAIAKQ